MTSDTAALESPRCSARFFKLTLEVAGVLREDCIPADFDLGMVLFSGSLAQEVEASNKKTTTNS
jgi:hypothetical protein